MRLGGALVHFLSEEGVSGLPLFTGVLGTKSGKIQRRGIYREGK